MRKALFAVLGLLLVTSAGAAEWKYEGGNVPIAWFDNGDAQFQFACRGGQLAMGFWVRKPDAAVAGSTALSLAITPDPAEGSKVTGGAGTSFAQDMPLVHSDGSSVIVRGPVARQWAKIAQGARDRIRVAYVRPAGSGLDVFDTNVFGAKGSSGAIAKVLAKCS
ncbi:hypothetical protein [Devosia sp. 1566]|uniref:hypothetical protein n=1 Tax=Devosia sp. 1566 TaxID=2499144 RepID=UPI000FD766B3|nr:hypothetical protein [Devosia sp. 1566]